MLGHSGLPRHAAARGADRLRQAGPRRCVNHVLLPVPTEKTKGVLVSPTVYGNVLLGPTADDIDDKTDRSTTAEGLESLMEAGARILPELVDEYEVTATYVGLRAATEHRDYQLRAHAEQRYVCAGGIRSTGHHRRRWRSPSGCGRRWRAAASTWRESPQPVALRMPNIGEFGSRPYQDGRADRARPRLRADRLLLRAGHARRDRRRAAEPDPARRPRRAAPPHPGADGPLPGILLRRRGDRDPARARWRSLTVRSIVGGGPSGLGGRDRAARLGISPVTVIEREREAGGIPRHSDHTGFGLRDLRTVLSGPRYAAALPRARRGGGSRGRRRDDGHRVGGGAPPEADRSGRPAGDRAARSGPGDRLPRAPAFRAARPRVAPRWSDDHLDAAAARPPAAARRSGAAR